MSWLRVLAVAGLSIGDAGDGHASTLAAAAQASPRPAQCDQVQSVWAESSRGAKSVFCKLLAQGYANLKTDPVKALRLAEIAEERSRAASATVLKARALVGLARYADAVELFVQASERQPSRSWQPEELHDYAAAAHMASQHASADVLFSKLLPRIQSLPPNRRSRAYLEAAFAKLAAGRDASARQPARELAARYAQRSLALAKRRGGAPFARAALRLFVGTTPRDPLRPLEVRPIADAAKAVESTQSLPTNAPRLRVVEWAALLALAYASEGRSESEAAWKRYRRLDPKGVFHSWAK